MGDNNLIQPTTEQGSSEQVYTVRAQKVILDFDLAKIYEVEENLLNEAVNKNLRRFPEDFMFQLNNQEWELLQTQFADMNQQTPGINSCPRAFTEKGVAMVSCILSSPAAIRINIQLIEAYTSVDKKRGDEWLAVFAILKKLLVKEQNPPREPIGFKIPKKN